MPEYFLRGQFGALCGEGSTLLRQAPVTPATRPGPPLLPPHRPPLYLFLRQARPLQPPSSSTIADFCAAHRRTLVIPGTVNPAGGSRLAKAQNLLLQLNIKLLSCRVSLDSLGFWLTLERLPKRVTFILKDCQSVLQCIAIPKLWQNTALFFCPQSCWL